MNKENNFLYQIEELIFCYSLGKQKIEALRNLNLNIPSRSLITLSGPSGSGKSTLLNLLGLLEPLQEGKILFLNEEISCMTNARKNTIRKFEIGFIFQQFHLMPVLTAEENVAYFLHNQNLSKKEIVERTAESLHLVNLYDHRKKKPSELSGGQKQRVGIARALAKRPSVIIGDEPTASLDRKNGESVMEILAQLVEEHHVSIVLTTHDAMVQSYADYNYHLQDGRLAET